MTVRGLWIISHENGGNPSIRFSRKFSTVEHRAKSLAGSSYVAVPEESTFLQLLLTELGLSDSGKNYVALRDDCLYRPRSPALELHVDGPGKGILWPVLTVSQGPLILACLPLVDVPPDPRPPLASLLSVSQGLTLLAGLQTFLLGSGSKPDSEGLGSRLAMLPSVFLQVCPLGTPLDVPLPGTPATPTAPTSVGTQKQPAWKTGLHRGRAVVNVGLIETVRSMQYGNRSRQDLWDVYVTLSLPPNGSPLQDILVHPCVTSLDSSILTASSVDNYDGSAFSGPYKFPFSPPLEPFRLCSYTSEVPVPPILGSYQLKEEENQLRVSVTLKLHESIKNSFEFCNAHLPFFNRDQMGVVDMKVSSGQLDVSKEKNLLVWVLGQKFPKSREVTMEGKINFSGPTPGPSDPLCTKLTAYVKLHFKVPDMTLSGCYVDQHSVQVYSSAKPRIVTSRELQSKEYYIWNSTGTAPVSSGQMMM
uniref:AP-5 complex subunit mu-1 n=1 Tax=Neolamprologus brichardi TaxID=32507 RepID=A0A3Q4GKF1_NEOBR